MDNGKKNASQDFTTDDIRKNARDWTLAGDVGLLAHLEQFSENIISKTEETQKNFNELVNDYEELYIKVGNVTNQFLALQNCQFVENRVYDEETPTEEKTEVKVQDEAEQEKLLLMQYKEAVEVGVKLLDTHFQEIQLPPNSDSDEDDEMSSGHSVIWKPKNLYAGKKFPLLIGSDEWWADDHVGLRANEEILDSDKIMSESESEIESLKSNEKPLKSSSSSSMEYMKSVPTKPAFLEYSEDIFGFNKNKNVNLADQVSKGSSSLLEEHTNFLPDFDEEPNVEENEKSDSVNEDQPQLDQTENVLRNKAETNKLEKVDNEFTRELVAKLVSVTNKTREENEQEEVGERSVPTSYDAHENLFDETDDSGDLFSTKTHKVTEKPVVKKNLFFDAENDDELFTDKNGLFSGGSLFEGDALKDIESQSVGQKSMESSVRPQDTVKKEVVETKKSSVNDLFDDLDDDDTLFAVKPVNNKTLAQSSSPMENSRIKAAQALDPQGDFWNNDDELPESVTAKTDRDIFSSPDLFDSTVSKTAEHEIFADKKSKTKLPELYTKEQQQPEKRSEKVEYFARTEASDSDSQVIKRSTAGDSFEDLFGFSSTTQEGDKKISILDSEDDDLFSKSLKEEKKLPTKIKALPEIEDHDAALFGDKAKLPDSVSLSSSRSSLFDDMSASKSRLASVFEKDKNSKSEDDLFSGADENLFVGDAKPRKDLFSTKGKEKGKSSLFDDCDDDDDDLFGRKEGPGETSSSGNSFGSSFKNIQSESKVKQIPESKEGFDDDLGDDDLFKISDATTKPRETKSDIFRNLDQKISVDFSDDSQLFSDKTETTKPKPPNSLSLRKTETETETEAKGKTVGKLSIPDNLKVRLEGAVKNISQRRVKSSEEEKNPEEQKEDVLDEPLQVSSLLKCPSKDRVKIPVRRRPQSRRARQEAIRKSGTWDQMISPSSASEATVAPKDSLPSPIVSNPLSPSTDEEDFFKVPELDKNFEKEDQSIFKSDLFETSKASKHDDSLLFDGAPVLSPSSPTKSEDSSAKTDEEFAKEHKTESLPGAVKPKTLSIFDDDDDDIDGDDENLFKISKPAVGNLLRTPGKTEGNIKKPLFDLDDNDEDNDDDLFGGTSRVSLKPQSQDKPKGGGESKEKTNSSFVDPLGLMK